MCQNNDVPVVPNTSAQLELLLLDDRVSDSLLLTGVIQGAIKEIKMLREIKKEYEIERRWYDDKVGL